MSMNEPKHEDLFQAYCIVVSSGVTGLSVGHPNLGKTIHLIQPMTSAPIPIQVTFEKR
jgi:hypothetical protein